MFQEDDLSSSANGIITYDEDDYSNSIMKTPLVPKDNGGSINNSRGSDDEEISLNILNPSTSTRLEEYNDSIISADQESLVYRRHAKHVENLRNIFESTKVGEEDLKKKNKRQRKFYQKQNDLIDQFLTPIDESAKEDDENDFRVKVAINGSLLVNILLFAMQITAAIITRSMALAATSIDAFMDLLSGFILFMTDRARKKKNYFEYPTGKSRMEPVGIIIFAALMSTVSINLLIEGGKSLIGGKENSKIDLDILSIIFVAIAIACKVLMYLYCRRLTHSSSAMILSVDHRNDITVNSFGMGMAILGHFVVWWLDPVGALIVALIILRSWTFEAYEQIQLLVGKTASPEVLQKLTYIALTHPHVEKVDTCRAFHVGNNLFVEVDIVLPHDMILQKTHDIGESLQIKLESLPEVERAFVHIDYDFTHKPEHKRN
eukprot:gene6254-7788_t